jgi:hypothetical protein
VNRCRVPVGAVRTPPLLISFFRALSRSERESFLQNHRSGDEGLILLYLFSDPDPAFFFFPRPKGVK